MPRKKRLVNPKIPISRSKLHEVMGKYLLDPSFQAAFKKNPVNAISQAGIRLTKNEKEVLMGSVDRLDKLANSKAMRNFAEIVVAYIDRSIAT